ncbi:MAG TPA: hypothetical protein VMQ59_07700 [Acidimicrobiales bacterium]|nr:hypothetical protein [Acidimicrobiales bacterium]
MVVVGGGSVVVVVVVVGGGTVVVDAGQVAAVVGGEIETAITVGPTVAAMGDGDGATTTDLVVAAVRDGLAACEPGRVELVVSGKATRGPALGAVEPFPGLGGTLAVGRGTSCVVVVVEVAYWSADTDEPTSGGRLPSKNRANPAVINAMATMLARQCSVTVSRPLATARVSLRPARRGGGKISPA